VAASRAALAAAAASPGGVGVGRRVALPPVGAYLAPSAAAAEAAAAAS